jgi:hypothetical protein
VVEEVVDTILLLHHLPDITQRCLVALVVEPLVILKQQEQQVISVDILHQKVIVADHLVAVHSMLVLVAAVLVAVDKLQGGQLRVMVVPEPILRSRVYR